uniref:Dysbindin domain containing 2 n=1 Tax=Tetraodon nigroviridis TaxID=99883 RepID=H3C5C4_TETNG
EAETSERALDNASAQHLRPKERQRFHEEVYQHDMDNYPPSAHLQIDCKKPPMGSISSMEVNVDILEQMDLMEISDQEALDVFLNSGSGAEEEALTSPIPGEPTCVQPNRILQVPQWERAPLRRQNEVHRGSKSRSSSTSSASSDASAGRAGTPVIQSDDEEVHADTLLLTSIPRMRDEETEEEEEEEKN